MARPAEVTAELTAEGNAVRAAPRCSRIALAGALLLAAPLLAQDELGLGRMWTFHDPPLAYLQRSYGFAPDADWLRMVQLASLRFGSGCSASFVSPQGLILTNHHCARAAIAKVQGRADWVLDGFVAATLGDEIKLPDLAVEQLIRTTDVTARMLEGVAADDAPDVADRRVRQNERAVLERARQDEPKLRPQVVALFHGARWQLYQYRVFDDVRLVMSPHLQIAQFGGDPDNFVFPRYCIDFALCRAYVDGAPADTAATSFGWSDGPAQEQLVFLTGNPGSTQRLRTTAELEFLRDARYPRVRELIDDRLEILRGLARTDQEREGAYGSLSILYQKQGREDLALRTLQDGTRQAPRSAALWGMLGAAYGRANRLDDALASYERSVALKPTALGSKTLAALLFERRGDRARALRLWRQSIALDPNQPDVQRFLKQYGP